jgi:hypothetical protein
MSLLLEDINPSEQVAAGLSSLIFQKVYSYLLKDWGDLVRFIHSLAGLVVKGRINTNANVNPAKCP